MEGAEERLWDPYSLYIPYVYIQYDIVSGWWLGLPLWKRLEFVNWDDDIPNWLEKKNHVPDHQPVTVDFMNELDNMHKLAGTNCGKTKAKATFYILSCVVNTINDHKFGEVGNGLRNYHIES